MAAVRRRSLDVQGNAKVPEELLGLAKEFYFANEEANAAGNKAKKARAALFSGMKDAGLTSFDVPASSGGATITLVAVVGEGRATTPVDVEKLRKLLNDDKKFMEIVSATKKAVVTHCGTAVADRVCLSEPGAETVTVKIKK